MWRSKDKLFFFFSYSSCLPLCFPFMVFPSLYISNSELFVFVLAVCLSAFFCFVSIFLRLFWGPFIVCVCVLLWLLSICVCLFPDSDIECANGDWDYLQLVHAGASRSLACVSSCAYVSAYVFV